MNFHTVIDFDREEIFQATVPAPAAPRLRNPTGVVEQARDFLDGLALEVRNLRNLGRWVAQGAMRQIGPVVVGSVWSWFMN